MSNKIYNFEPLYIAKVLVRMSAGGFEDNKYPQKNFRSKELTLEDLRHHGQGPLE